MPIKNFLYVFLFLISYSIFSAEMNEEINFDQDSSGLNPSNDHQDTSLVNDDVATNELSERKRRPPKSSSAIHPPSEKKKKKKKKKSLRFAPSFPNPHPPSGEIEEEQYQKKSVKIVREAKKIVKKSKSALLDEMRDRHEVERLHRAFENVDELLDKAVIKVQRINDHDEIYGKEQIVTLDSFLSRPHQYDKIVEKIKSFLNLDLDEDALGLIRSLEKMTFPKAINILWRNEYISKDKAEKLLLKVSPLSSQETIRLFENGAVRSKSGYFVLLRTGGDDNFGDALGLGETIARVVDNIRDEDEYEEGKSLGDLLNGPLRERIIEEFAAFGIDDPEDLIDDSQVLYEIKRHLLLFNNIATTTWFKPSGAGSGTMVNTENMRDIIITPEHLSAMIVGNHYFEDLNASTSHGLFVNPLGITYSGSLSFEGHGPSWWLNYTDGYLGGGVNYTFNFDQGTMWSKGDPTYLSIGFFGSGWRDRLSAGVTLQTLLANGVGVGVSGSMSVCRNHDVKLVGAYPLDGKIKAIRGLKKVEIDDRVGVGLSAGVSANFTAADVPVAVAFQASANFTRKKIYRTFWDLKKFQRAVPEMDVPGVLYLLGKKIKETRLPSFNDPQALQDGDELVEIKSGVLRGSFVLGIEGAIPIHAARIGASVEMSAEFELGLRSLSNNKYEVSVEPLQVFEFSLFESILNVFGAGQVKGLAMARKQIFIFDFDKEEARTAYFDLIQHGTLPSSSEIEVHMEGRGPEYLLSQFRAQNNEMRQRGVERTYIEKVDVSTEKLFAGFQAPIIGAGLTVVNKIEKIVRANKKRLNLRFAGVDMEFMHANAKSVASNGIIAVRRSTFGGRRSIGQGFSGRYTQDLFVTHRRVHSIDESPYNDTENKWSFDSLVIHAQLADTIITGNEENKMAENINNLFSTFIDDFEVKDSKEPRTINIERQLSAKDLHLLTLDRAWQLVPRASSLAGVPQSMIKELLEKLRRNPHPDQRGLLVKEFIEACGGLSGFSVIHHLLGAKPEDIILRTTAGYQTTIMAAKTFIAKYSNPNISDSGVLVNIRPSKSKKQKKHIRKFYREARAILRDIDEKLRLLYDDKYFVDEKSSLYKIYDEGKVQELLTCGARQSKNGLKVSLVTTRKTILELLDLRSQGFSEHDQMIIFKHAKSDNLRFVDQVQMTLASFNDQPIQPYMSKKEIRKRMKKAWDMMEKIQERLRRISEDFVMNEMDPNYVEHYVRTLELMHQDFRDSTALDHLSQKDASRIHAKFDSHSISVLNALRRSSHMDHKIEGAITNYMTQLDRDERQRFNTFTHGQIDQGGSDSQSYGYYQKKPARKTKEQMASRRSASLVHTSNDFVNDQGYWQRRKKKRKQSTFGNRYSPSGYYSSSSSSSSSDDDEYCGSGFSSSQSFGKRKKIEREPYQYESDYEEQDCRRQKKTATWDKKHRHEIQQVPLDFDHPGDLMGDVNNDMMADTYF